MKTKKYIVSITAAIAISCGGCGSEQTEAERFDFYKTHYNDCLTFCDSLESTIQTCNENETSIEDSEFFESTKQCVEAFWYYGKSNRCCKLANDWLTHEHFTTNEENPCRFFTMSQIGSDGMNVSAECQPGFVMVPLKAQNLDN